MLRKNKIIKKNKKTYNIEKARRCVSLLIMLSKSSVTFSCNCHVISLLCRARAEKERHSNRPRPEVGKTRIIEKGRCEIIPRDGSSSGRSMQRQRFRAARHYSCLATGRGGNERFTFPPSFAKYENKK